jgi:prevent-host-death family protein
MKTVSIHDAKTNLSKYIDAVKNGEEIYIGSYGKPEVRLVAQKPKKVKVYRKLGLAKGKVWASPDAFSKETDEEIAKMLYGD